MRKHAASYHGQNSDLQKVVGDFNSTYGRQTRKSTEQETTLSQVELPPTDSQELNRAAASVIIDGFAPLGTFDSDAMRDFVETVSHVSVTRALLHVSALNLPRPQEIPGIAASIAKDVTDSIQSRRNMTEKWVPQECDRLFQEACSKMVEQAKSYGCTLGQVRLCNDHLSSSEIFFI